MRSVTSLRAKRSVTSLREKRSVDGLTARQRMDIWAAGRRPSPAQLDIVSQVLKINRLRLEGHGCRTIGKALGIDPWTVNKWLRRLGWGPLPERRWVRNGGARARPRE